MQIESLLYGAADRAASVTTSTARSAADLVQESAVQATGSTQPADAGVVNTKGPAMAAAVLAFAALGVIVAMRQIFAGAIS